jgi:hypothetical protein
MSTATVSKNEHTGHWIVKYGDQVADLGKTAASCHNAHWLAVTMNHAPLANLVTGLLEKWPLKGLEKRAQKAAILAANGHVMTTDDGPDHELKTKGAVISQSDPDQRYYIILDRAWLHCSCPDHASTRVPVADSGQRLCKHVLAFCMTTHLLAKNKPARKAVTFRSQPFVVDGRQRREPDDPPQYANGDAVHPDDLTQFKTFVDAMRTAPYNREKLIGWTLSSS